MEDIGENIQENINEEEKYQDLDFDNFDDYLCEYHNGDLLAGIHGYGFERPSPIQSKAILPMCDRRDVVAQAQAGSGKTGAFVIPSLALVDPSKEYPQVIIIGNTRQLAQQIHYVVTKIGVRLISNSGLNVMLCVGGNNTEDLWTSLKKARSSQILIGTPGKLIALGELDSKKNNKIKLFDRIKLLVLDEADELLKREFVPQIHKIISNIAPDTQVCLFSATYPQEVLNLTKKILRNPIKILVEKEKISVEAIKHFYVPLDREDDKYDNLVDIYQQVNVCQAVIFVNSIEKGSDLSRELISCGHSIGVIHSKLDEIEKNEILKQFRLTQTRILIATDLISRGIDVQSVGLVINYDVPHDSDKYIHRVGRSGRFGKLGVAITFMVKNRGDISRMKEIEQDYKIEFDELRNKKDIQRINSYLTGMKCTK